MLVEIHAHYRDQIEIAKQTDWVYDFALPPLVLHTLFRRDARDLKRWLEISPRNAVTVLDTHDGIGVLDVGPTRNKEDEISGLRCRPEQIDALVETIHSTQSGRKPPCNRRRGQQSRPVPGQLHLLRRALGARDDEYLIARALQFFAPGVPQVYYGGLLAGSNDLDLLRRTGIGRDINRHSYTASRIKRSAATPGRALSFST